MKHISGGRSQRTLLFNVCPATLVLASYVDSRRPGQYRFGELPLNGPKLDEALADPDTILCLSLCGVDEIHLAHNLFTAVRASSVEPSGSPKIVLGGAFFDAISAEDFVDMYPEASHVVQGDGEEALLHVLEGSPSETIVRGSTFPEPRPFRLRPLLPWHVERAIPIRRQPFHCAWDKCRFCFHTAGPGRSAVPMQEFCESISEYYHKHGWTKFYIFDNYTEPPDLEYLLRYCEQEKLPVQFDVLGMMMVKPALKLRPLLERTKLVRYMGWGLESYHQPTLKQYRKGTNLKNVKPLLEMAKAAGVFSFVFILAGLPQVSDEAYESTYRFLRDHTSGDNKLIDGIALSWFLFSPQLSDRLDNEDFGLTPREVYTVADYACDLPAARGRLSKLRTIYNRFDIADQALGRTFDRDELFLRHGEHMKKMLLLPGAKFDFRNYFIQLDTWRKIWGKEMESWMAAQPRSLAARPAPKKFSILELARRRARQAESAPIC